MAKKYNHGEYISLYWNDGPEYLYVRGHLDPQEARKIMEYEEDYLLIIDDPIEEYGRWGVGINCEGEPSQLFYPYTEPGRGRFPVMSAKIIGRWSRGEAEIRRMELEKTV